MITTRSPGKRLLCMVLSLISVLILTLPAAATETADTAEVYYSTNIHSTASHSALSIGQLEDGTALTVIGEKGDFFKIDCYDMTGYIARSQTVEKDHAYYVSCAPDSPDTQVVNYTPMADALELRASLLQLAQKQLGSRYVFGSSRPGAFDCSGLTYYLYGQHGLPIHRTASTQMQDGIIVSFEGMQVGDLVFFHEAGYPNLSSHVGIYIGDGKIIHSSRRGVIVSSLAGDYYMETFLCARRIVNVRTAQSEIAPTGVNQRASGLNIRTIGLRTVN